MLSPPSRIHPNPGVRLPEIADGRFCAIVDDVPEHPESLVNFAARHKSRFALHGVPPDRGMDVNDLAELLEVVPAGFNPLIFYDGEAPHSGHITQPQLLTDVLAEGRLTFNFFASVNARS